MPKSFRFRSAAAMGVALFAASLATAVRAEIIEQILVKVNGEILTKTDLEARQIAALRQRGQQMDLRSDQGNVQLKKALDEVTPQILVDVVDEMLIVQRGKELGYKLSDDQFKAAVDSIKKDNKIENDEQFQAALKQEGMTMADLRRNFEKQMIISRVEQNEVLGKVGVSEEEARAYYDTHLGEFTSPPTVTLREILVAVAADPKGINVAQDEAAKEKADKIRARAAADESFEKLAADMSDAPSRANAGLIGPLSVKDLSPEFQKLIESMKPGAVTEPIRTPRGYQILKLEASTGPQTMTFEQAREQIGDHVFAGKRQAEFQKWLEKLRAEAIIEWKNPEVRKAYEQGITRQKKPAA
jgi:parvulin-like peptidyl-prolyl isomerase